MLSARPDNRTEKFELAVNAVTHVFILFTALTVLFVLVISKTETDAIEGEILGALTTHLSNTLAEGNRKSSGKLKEFLAPTVPAISTVELSVQGDDEATVNYNNGLFQNAYLVCGLFLTIIITMIVTMRYGADLHLTRVFLLIIAANIVLFMIIGAIEFTFFKKVAIHYVPVRPSFLTEHVIGSIKTAVDTAILEKSKIKE